MRPPPLSFVAGLILLLVLNSVLRFAFISSLTVTCIALSVVLLTGYVGQVSLAQMSLAGFGGFMLGHISHGWGIGFPFSLIVAGLICSAPRDASSACRRCGCAASTSRSSRSASPRRWTH